VLLKTLGHPALHRDDGTLAGGLRRKDLALLVYLCVEGLPVHARGRLAALLWGESTEERARHSLTQAVGRLLRVLPSGVLAPDKEAVRWTGGLPCDAVALLRERMEPKDVDDAFSLYAGHFLEGFDPGAGAQDFREWADRRRAELRNAALRLLDRAGERAEAVGSWGRALRLGERAVEIDPVWEQGHRRIMRALAARGERNGALRHYQRLETYLDEEVGGRPDPDTRTLAEHLRASDASRAVPPPPAPGRVPVPDDAPVVDAARQPVPGPDADPPPAVEDPVLSAVAGGVAAAPADPLEAFIVLSSWESADSPVRVRSVPAEGRRVSPWLWIALAGALAAAIATAAWDRRAKSAAVTERPPAHGESVRMRGSKATDLALGHTLYKDPDASTLPVCREGYPDVRARGTRDAARAARMLPTTGGWAARSPLCTQIATAVSHGGHGGQIGCFVSSVSSVPSV
jgi:DNA-binding SARP family transcriptional activator